MSTFGERLRTERNKKGITQQYLAEKLNVDRTTVSKWEKDQSIPTIQDAQMLADALEISLYYLVEGEETEQESEQKTAQEPVKEYMIFFLLCVLSVMSIPLGSVTCLIAVIYSFRKKFPTILKVLGVLLWLVLLQKLYYYLGLHHLL